MCPEYKNEKNKDTSVDLGVESEAEKTAFGNTEIPKFEANSSDSAENCTESAGDIIESNGEATDNASEDSEREVTENATEEGDAEVTENDEENSTELHPEEDGNSPKVAVAITVGKNYLFYGGEKAPEGINYAETRKFLAEQLKYDGGELGRARHNKDGSGIVNTDENATEFCSYCGRPISGVDYYRLPDGRKRCTNCNRSLVKSVEELNSIFNDLLINMELFFGATIDAPVTVEMIEERKLKKKLRKGLGNPPANVLILGVAVEHKGKYTIYVENGIPRASLIATLAHELTHIWQYTHWNEKRIKKTYGSKLRLVIYEGMAMWTEIQYLYHIGEQDIAKREEHNTILRQDEYGIGFTLYADRYPINRETKAFIETPFSAGDTPLDISH